MYKVVIHTDSHQLLFTHRSANTVWLSDILVNIIIVVKTMEINSDASTKSLCSLQEIFTDFDAWLCRYRVYFSDRNSFYPQTYVSLTENQTEDKKRLNYGVSITLEHLIVEGFITNKKNNIKIQDYHNFLKFIQNGDDFLTFINGAKKYMRSKLLFCFIIICVL